jgi:hypothetical protein
MCKKPKFEKVSKDAPLAYWPLVDIKKQDLFFQLIDG